MGSWRVSRMHKRWRRWRGDECRAKLAQLRQALEGRVDEHHRLLLRHLLDHITFLDAEVEKLDEQIEQRLVPYHKQLALLLQIPGIGRTTAAAILGEIGIDMTCFASDKHLASWAGVAPGN